LATTFAGTRCRITKEIHIHDIIVAIAMMAVTIATIGRDTVVQVAAGEMGMTMDHGAV
jgi:hypothetical protein